MNEEIPDFTVRDGIWDENTKILEVRKRQHKVAFRDSPQDEWHENSLLMCNNCGEVLSYNGKVCAHCGYKLDD